MSADLQSSIHLPIAADNPAILPSKIIAERSFICKRLAEAMIYGWLYNIDTIYCNTLATNDRGYFPRKGVIDRLYNPNSSYYLVKHLHAFFSSTEFSSINSTSIAPNNIEFDEDDGNTLLQIETEGGNFILAISISQDWLTGVVADALISSGKVKRLSWLAGSLDELSAVDDYLSNCEANWVDSLGIEILIS